MYCKSLVTGSRDGTSHHELGRANDDGLVTVKNNVELDAFGHRTTIIFE